MKKYIGLVLAALIVLSTLAGCTGQTGDKSDVVVIGAGGAGLAAAIAAHDEGAKVVVLEKMPMVGGNTLRATGGLNAAGTSFQKEKGLKDSPELFFEDTMKGGKNLNNPELVKVLTSQAAVSVEWLTKLGADLSDVGRLGGASVNRAHRPKGGAAVGAHIVEVLKKAAEDRKIDIRLWNKAIEVLKDKDGNVTGVKALNKEGKEYTIKAKAVIIAAGGFGASQEMVVKYQPNLKGFGTTNHSGAAGDGIDLAVKIGAQLVDMKEIQTHPTVVPEKGIMITEAVRGNGAVLVNHDGQRFVNELQTRDVVSKAILDQQGKTAYLIFDEGLRKSLLATEEYFGMGLVTEASSVEELASKLSIKPEVLKETLDKYNKAVEGKEDAEFKRPDMPRQLNTGSFYAIEVAPAVHHTMGGIKINNQTQVLAESGEPIKGLFAAGEATGGIHGANRLGGNALADIISFGRIAGSEAAKNIKSK